MVREVQLPSGRACRRSVIEVGDTLDQRVGADGRKRFCGPGSLRTGIGGQPPSAQACVTMTIGDPGPQLPGEGIVNGASFRDKGIAVPGGIVTLFGTVTDGSLVFTDTLPRRRLPPQFIYGPMQVKARVPIDVVSGAVPIVLMRRRGVDGRSYLRYRPNQTRGTGHLVARRS